jgi:hypothetical protein
MLNVADFDGDALRVGYVGLPLLRDGVINFVELGDRDCSDGDFVGIVPDLVTEESSVMERDAVPVTCMLTEPWVEEGDTVFEIDLPSSDKEYESETLPDFDDEEVFVGSFVSEMVGEPTDTVFVGESSGVAEIESEISQLRELDVLASCVFDAVADCVLDLLWLFRDTLMD